LSRDALESVVRAMRRRTLQSSAYGMGISSTEGESKCSRSPNYYYCAAISEAWRRHMSLRGHVQCEGGPHGWWSPKSRLPPDGRDRIEGVVRLSNLRPTHGHERVAAIRNHRRKVHKATHLYRRQSAVALPDPAQCHRAIAQLDLADSDIGTKVNRSHCWSAKESFIFPCLGRTEQDIQSQPPQSITVEDSMSMVHRRAASAACLPASCDSRTAIVAGMAHAKTAKQHVPWLDLSLLTIRIRDAIEAVFPEFQDLNNRIRMPGGFRCRCAHDEGLKNRPPAKANYHVPRCTEDAEIAAADV